MLISSDTQINCGQVMGDHADTLTLKEVELDYEADEGDDGRAESPTSYRDDSKNSLSSPRTDDGDVISSPILAPDREDDLESGEELEDGEISDEDETLRNERNEPKPVCRFYNKGQCTWGASCRFLHPGVLDKGNYSMFATPRPILPGEPDKEDQPKEEEVEPVLMRPPPPAFETAWERGLRQAKEMRRRSHKRREMDVEYEEKKASLSLTQIELDKENDYYTRPASPAHTHDPYADDEYADSSYESFQTETTRRIAPPPPADFVARGERANSRRRYSESPPPRVRRVAPPRSPSPVSAAVVREDPYRQRFKGGEDWADPWMRSKDEKPRGRPRRRSYSSGSSRSSSKSSSSSRSPSIRRRRRYSTSASSRSSSKSRSDSRSRSSSPEGIPRRSGANPGLPPPVKNTAPLQKRLAAVTQQKGVSGGRIKLEGGVNIKQEGDKKQSLSREQTKTGQKERDRSLPSDDGKQKEPFKMNLPKNQIKLTLKTATGKPANTQVLDKLGTNKDDLECERKKRKLEDPSHPDSIKLKKLENQELMETLKQRLKTNLEAKQAKQAEAKSFKAKKLQEVMDNEKKVDNKEKKKKTVGGAGEGKTRRKEELLKQLKAVEEAIHRKRTKLEK